MPKQLKTLVVEYTPRDKESRTKKLREYFTDLIKEKTDLEFVDLAKNLPPLFDQNMIQAYHQRAYKQSELTKDELKNLKEVDKLRDQFLSADVLILTAPMYNFGYPAPVKAWIDSVMQKGYVYDVDENGHIPKLKHLKVCLIYTSGIVFDQLSENTSWNGLEAEGARFFEYMGAGEVRVVHIQGVDMLEEKYINFRTKIAKKRLNGLAINWFGIKKGNLETY